ncbi:unnamed protein product [Rhizoctonia solani]|uniref:MYND-type domain-containing protein n=1 Tax=Rhizoctonia solani TaxID=456999 RepID=A0A8H3EF37_9AGAM|nr:unnamed protein product [Rhizoctonia solani]
MTSSHPRWGRAIASLSPPTHRKRLTLSVDSELTGLQAMEKISRLAADGHLATRMDAETEIDISTLESSLLLAQDPMTIRHLANPPVISGCVRLMRTMIGQRPGVASPFSYEYGLLCFNLLVFCLNICLLERWNQLYQPLEMGRHTPNAPAHVWTSIEVSYAVIDQFKVLKDEGDCDWVLGWSASSAHPRQTLLLSQSDIAALLQMLWDDRKLFLKYLALYAAAVPGLSGLFFMFSRYLTQVCDSEQDRDGDALKIRLYELALRYQAVADAYQGEANMKIIYANSQEFAEWTKTTKHIDEEDSRLIVAAAINQVANYEDSDISLLLAHGPAVLTQLVPFAMDARSQDLLPEVLRSLIQSGWLWLLEMVDNDNSEAFIQMFFPTIVSMIRPHHNQSYQLSPSTQTKVMDVIYDGDLINLSACAMIRLNPANTETFAVRIIPAFFRVLAETLPEDELRRHLWDYAPDWDRFYTHLEVVAYGIPTSPSSRYQEHYRICIYTWSEIAHLLDFEHSPYYGGVSECFSGRCPRAYPSGTALFGCADCAVAVYCNDRCQSMGWMFGHFKPPHRQLCRTNVGGY